MKTMSINQKPEDKREQVYALMAKAVDDVAADQERLFLAKVTLMLALKIDNPDVVAEILSRCRSDL